MDHSTLRRAHGLMAWAPCAPRFVASELQLLLERRALPGAVRDRLRALQRALAPIEPPPWTCRFPALAGPDAPETVEGGLLTVVASDPAVLPPRGSRPASRALDLPAGFPALTDLHVVGLPTVAGAIVTGGSGSAAAWLAARARESGRPIPPGVVVSANLAPGPGTEPRLAPVEGGSAKARVVAREAPGARLYLCGEAEGEAVVALEAGAPVRDLEALIWGNVATTDRTEIVRVASVARDAFDRHDYAGARPRYLEVVRLARPDDGELAFEACLRLAAIAVHQGRPDEAAAWYERADAVPVPPSKKRGYAVERQTGLAGRAIDAFEPRVARELLQQKAAQNAMDPDHHDLWERIQVLGAWRRLYLLDGEPGRARETQLALLAATDATERPRTLLDLGLVELRCGNLAEAAAALWEARALIEAMDPVYRIQSRAFLTWHVARLACHGDSGDLGGLLEAETLGALLAEATLQPAGRWRVEAVRAARGPDLAALEALGAALEPFQRWYLGVFLLEREPTRELGWKVLAGSGVELGGMPQLAEAVAARDAAGVIRHAAY